MENKKKIISFEIYTLRSIAKGRKLPIPSQLRMFRYLFDNLEQDDPIYSELLEQWNKQKHHIEQLYDKKTVDAIDKKTQLKIDNEVLELDIKSNTKITFLLGAGASEPSKIPTVDTLLSSLWDKAKKLNRDDIDKLSEFCNENEIKNIEDLLTAAYLSNFAAKKNSVLSLLNYFLFLKKDAETEFRSSQRMTQDVDTSSISLLQETLHILFNLLTSTMISAKPNDAHYAIAQFVCKHKNTSIITTNYDCCIDEALTKQGLTIKKTVDSISTKKLKQEIELIKMHGSINWAYCESCQYTREFNFSHMKKAYKNDTTSYPVIGICKKCTATRRPLLVPPLSFKFMMFPSLIQLWNSARLNIEKAKYLIVVGYSFSDADNYITKIVSLSMSKHTDQKMIIVTKDADLVDLLKNKLSVSIENFDKSRILNAQKSCELILPEILKSNI